MWNPMETMGMGHGSDSLIAHITPKEAMILKAMGGKGTINPHTGFLQFFDDSGSGSDDSGSYGGSENEGGYGDDQGGGYSSSDMDSAFGGTDSFGGDDAADRDAGLGMTANLTGSGLEEGQTLGAPREGMNVQDMDIGPSNMGMMESLGARVRASYNSFMDNPLDALTPSYSTLGMVLGALSPMPGGMMFGNMIGRTADKYGAPSMESITGMPSMGTQGPEGNIGEIPEAQQAPSEVAGLAPTAAVTSAITPNYQTQNYLQDQTWRSLANRGTGGGGLSRLLRG